MSALVLSKLKDSPSYFSIIDKSEKDGRSLIVTGFGDTELSRPTSDGQQLYGVSIVETKKISKKTVSYEHILLTKEKLIELLKFMIAEYTIAEHTGDINTKKELMLSCWCGSEVIRVVMDFDDDVRYIDVFDNYFFRCPNGIKSSIAIGNSEIEKIQMLLEYLEGNK